MSAAVVIGAGCIGRGFVGPLFVAAGWHVTFLDIDAPLVDALARDGSYVQITVSTDESVRTVVGPVSAVDDGRDPEAAVAALVMADVACTAVGGGNLAAVAPLIAATVTQRVAQHRPPLNVLLCENVHHAATVMRGLLEPLLSAEELDQVGLLETSIDRTIPVVEEAIRATDPSVIYVDPCRPLPFDVASVRGPGFDVPGVVGDPSVPFAFFGERKLYVHNLGHALTAYLGEREGLDLIADAIAIPDVLRIVRAVMVESATALASAYTQPIAPLVALVDDLLDRFADRTLPDTIARVGRDPIRKTSPGDRFVGPYRLALRQGLSAAHLSFAVAVGADALRRHEGWTADEIRTHLGLDDLVPTELDLLDAQVALLAETTDLTGQFELIERYWER